MNRATHFFAASLLALTASATHAQSSPTVDSPRKLPVYGEVGLGFGQTLFRGDLKEKLTASLGGSFDAGIGNNLMVGFYVAPDNWRGLGLGARIKGTFGTSVTGDFGDRYIFNYYNLALTAKAYPFSQRFNRGLYVRGSFGFGQLTTKRLNEAQFRYTHQYAIGTSVMGGLGYTIPLKRTTLSFEAEFDASNRNGTISGRGDGQAFRSGQIGVNGYLTF